MSSRDIEDRELLRKTVTAASELHDADPYHQNGRRIEWDNMLAERKKWSTDLCQCTGDCGTWCLGFWCPCALFGQNVNKAFGDNAAGFGTAWCVMTPLLNWSFGGTKRTAMRIKYDVDGTGGEDVCTHFLCTSCALAQEAREIDIRENRPRQTVHAENGVRVSIATPASVATASTERGSRPRVRTTNSTSSVSPTVSVTSVRREPSGQRRAQIRFDSQPPAANNSYIAI